MSRPKLLEKFTTLEDNISSLEGNDIVAKAIIEDDAVPDPQIEFNGTSSKCVGVVETSTFVGRTFYLDINISDATNNGMIVSFNDSDAGYIYNTVNENKLRMRTTVVDADIANNAVLPVGDHKVVIILNGSNNGKMFVDGVLQTLTENYADEFTINKVALGLRTGGGELYFNGGIKDIRISSNIITDQQALDITSGAVSVNTIMNYSNTEVIYTLENQFETQKLQMDGSNDYMRLNSNVESLLHYNNNWCYRIKATVGGSTGRNSVTTLTATQASQWYILLGLIDWSADTFGYFYYPNSSAVNETFPAGKDIVEGGTYDMVFNCHSSGIDVWLDGVKLGTGSKPASAYGYTFDDGFGEYADGHAPYKTALHRFDAFDRELTDTEVQYLFNGFIPSDVFASYDASKGHMNDLTGNGYDMTPVGATYSEITPSISTVINNASLTSEYDLTATDIVFQGASPGIVFYDNEDSILKVVPGANPTSITFDDTVVSGLLDILRDGSYVVYQTNLGTVLNSANIFVNGDTTVTNYNNDRDMAATYNTALFTATDTIGSDFETTISLENGYPRLKTIGTFYTNLTTPNTRITTGIRSVLTDNITSITIATGAGSLITGSEATIVKKVR